MRRQIGLPLVGLLLAFVQADFLLAQVWTVPLDIRPGEPDGARDKFVAQAVEFTPDGKFVAAAGYFRSAGTAAGQGQVRLFDATEGSLKRVLSGTADSYAARAGSVAISPSGKLIAAAGWVTPPGEKAHKAVIDVFDAAESKLLRTLRGDRRHLSWVAFSPDEKTLLAARWLGPVEVWDLESGECVATFCDAGNVAVFSPDGKIIATRGNDDRAAIMFWRVVGKEVKEVGRIPAVEIGPLSIAFSPDGKLIAVAGLDKDGSSPVYVWELSRPEREGDPITAIRKVRLTGHKNVCYSVAFSPDGLWLVSTNQDQTARVWSMKTMTEAAIIPAHRDFVYDAAFSPDGNSLVTLGRDAMMLWELKSLLRGK